jgi:hypothetical protein
MSHGVQNLRETWREDPVGVALWYTFGKFKHLWMYPYYLTVNEPRVFNVHYYVVQSYHSLLLGLGCLGAVMMLAMKKETNKRLKLLLPVSIIYSCIVYLPYFTMNRYAYPLMPLVFLLAAVGICRGAHWLDKERGPGLHVDSQ